MRSSSSNRDGIPDLQAWNGLKMGVVCPKLVSAALECCQGNLQIKNTRSGHLQGCGGLHQAPGETGARHPDFRAPCFGQAFDESECFCGCGRPARDGRVCNDTPEFDNRAEHHTPAARIACCTLYGLSRAAVLRRTRPVSVNQKVRIDCNHRFCRSQLCILLRSRRSRSGGRPPSTVIQRILRAAFMGRTVFRDSCARSPSSTSSRKGRLSSTARFLASMSKSSGNSTVVFLIQETIIP
jgi:hypothetical protein